MDAKNESAGMTPLHLAVANDQHAAARLLVHSGANVCLPDARGLTPLRLTVEMADAPTVALLLSAEPPPDLSVEDQVRFLTILLCIRTQDHVLYLRSGGIEFEGTA